MMGHGEPFPMPAPVVTKNPETPEESPMSEKPVPEYVPSGRECLPQYLAGLACILGFVALIAGLALLQDWVIVPVLKLLPGDLGHGLIADLKCGPGMSWSPDSGCY